MSGAMLVPVGAEDMQQLRALIRKLAETWNRMDGHSFARLFTPDAVFVDIKAVRDDGRAAIGERHVWLFETVFRDTSIAYDLVDASTIGPKLALGHIRAHVDTGGGTLETLATCLFRYDNGAWSLLMFHNTEIGHYGV